MKKIFQTIQNEQGYSLLIAMMVLFAMTSIGIMTLKNTDIELKIAGNERLSKLAFFTAESARAYVAGHLELYNAQVMDDPGYILFPEQVSDKSKAGSRIQNVCSKDYFCLDYDPTDTNFFCRQKFRGKVEYIKSPSKRPPPRESGFSLNDYSANIYEMTVKGYYDPNSNGKFSACQCLKQGFYRIGL